MQHGKQNKNLKKYLSRISALIILIVLFSYSNSNAQEFQGIPFENTMWVLSTLDGSVSNIQARITFSNGTVSGFAPCNTYSGKYTLSGNSITISDIMATDKSCESINSEKEYFRLIESATSYEIIDGYLTLHTSGDYKTIVFGPAN